jgi:sugar phosphate isomerase/epimerase
MTLARPVLSTAWMQPGHRSLAEFFDAARELGFDAFELNHQVSEEMVREAALPQDEIPSVHAPCPTNPRTRSAQLSSLDKEERAHAVQATTASIQLAEQIGAQAVVIHAGRVAVNPVLDTELRALYDREQKAASGYADLKAELAAERARHAGRHVDAVRWSLERLAAVADSAGVKLGLEVPFFYYEIPLPDEADRLLQEFAGPLAFWLDIGHAYVLEELGFVDHGEWLSGFGEQIIGVHLHDVRVVREQPNPGDQAISDARLQDHVTPGTGVVDFAEVLRRAPAHSIFTCEFDAHNSPDEVKAGLAYLRELGFYS